MKRTSEHLRASPRYAELLAGGPEITAADRKRLRTFVPRLTPIALAVRWAFFTMTREKR